MTKRKRKKSEYLSYIEETKKHFGQLKEVAAMATKNAVNRTKARKLPITYKKGNQIIREYDDGRKEIIGTINKPAIQVKKGATIKLR